MAISCRYLNSDLLSFKSHQDCCSQLIFCAIVSRRLHCQRRQEVATDLSGRNKHALRFFLKLIQKCKICPIINSEVPLMLKRFQNVLPQRFFLKLAYFLVVWYKCGEIIFLKFIQKYKICPIINSEVPLMLKRFPNVLLQRFCL